MWLNCNCFPLVQHICNTSKNSSKERYTSNYLHIMWRIYICICQTLLKIEEPTDRIYQLNNQQTFFFFSISIEVMSWWCYDATVETITYYSLVYYFGIWKMVLPTRNKTNANWQCYANNQSDEKGMLAQHWNRDSWCTNSKVTNHKTLAHHL